MHIHTYIHVHIHTYTCTYIHTYIHVHIHTYTSAEQLGSTEVDVSYAGGIKKKMLLKEYVASF